MHRRWAQAPSGASSAGGVPRSRRPRPPRLGAASSPLRCALPSASTASAPPPLWRPGGRHSRAPRRAPRPVHAHRRRRATAAVAPLPAAPSAGRGRRCRPAAPSACGPGRPSVAPGARSGRRPRPVGPLGRAARPPPAAPSSVSGPANAAWRSRVLRVGPYASATRRASAARCSGETRRPRACTGARPPTLARSSPVPRSAASGRPSSRTLSSSSRVWSTRRVAKRARRPSSKSPPCVVAASRRTPTAGPRAPITSSAPRRPVVPEVAELADDQDELRLPGRRRRPPPSGGAARSRRAISAVRCARSAPTRAWSSAAMASPAWWRSPVNGSGARRSATVQIRRASGGRSDARAATMLVSTTSVPPPGRPATSTCPSPPQSAYSTSPPATTPSGSSAGPAPSRGLRPPGAGAGPPPAGRPPARPRPGRP